MEWRRIGDERVKKIWLTQYDYAVVIILGSNVHESRVARNRKLGPYPDPTKVVDGLTDTFDGGSLVFLRHNACPNTIAHECYHVVCNLMEHIDAKHEEEIVAYTLGHLVGEVTTFVKKK